MKAHYLGRVEELRAELVKLGTELDRNLYTFGEHRIRAKVAESVNHATAGLLGIAQGVRSTITTPTFYQEPEEAAPCSG